MKLVICNCSAIFIVRQFHRQNNMCARCCCFLDYDFNETWEPKRIYDVEILSKIISKETISVSNIRCQRLLLTSQMNCSFREKKKKIRGNYETKKWIYILRSPSVERRKTGNERFRLHCLCSTHPSTADSFLLNWCFKIEIIGVVWVMAEQSIKLIHI